MNFQEYVRKNDYKNVLQYFGDISAIPRGSLDNQRISDYLVSFAKAHGLNCVQDSALNVIIYKPATKGYEDHPAVLLQGHMDMVCVKSDDSTHDFTKEGLTLLMDKDEIYADRTTLGGDNGIAVAMTMALLADQSIQHPALEVVITTDEETGMNGAINLDPALFSGTRMMNLDSEEEGTCWCSCAGGMGVDAFIKLNREAMEGEVLTLSVTGLSGGHSGADIHKKKPNATLLLARILSELLESERYSLISLQGGEKGNAIPVKAVAKIVINENADFCKNQIAELFLKHQKRLCNSEPLIEFTQKSLGNTAVSAMTMDSADKLIKALLLAPNGAQTMSGVIPGLVETSLNLGIFTTSESEAEFHYSLRSSVMEDLTFLRKKLQKLFEMIGGTSQYSDRYPAWEYKENSVMQDLYKKLYYEIYGKKAEVTAIHAGLECGIFAEKLKDIDIISIGPDMKSIHTIKERLDAASSIRVYQFIEKMLENL